MEPVVFIISHEDAIDHISSNNSLLDVYKELNKKYKGLKLFTIFTKVENQIISYGSPEVLRMMKDNYQLLMFESISDIKLFDVPSNLIRKYKNSLDSGDAFFLSNNELKRIKTVSVQ